MGDEPKKKWGMRAGAGAAGVLTIGQIYFAQEFFYTRKEAEAQEKRVERMETAFEKKTDEIKLEVAGLRTEVSTQNRNVGILMHELRKRIDAAEKDRDEALEAAANAKWGE